MFSLITAARAGIIFRSSTSLAVRHRSRLPTAFANVAADQTETVTTIVRIDFLSICFPAGSIFPVE
jgi:hypothetical protein